MENDTAHTISMSRTSSQVDDAHAVVGATSGPGDQDENLRRTPEQVEQHEESLATGHEAQKEALEAEMKYQLNRRHFLRQVQKDIAHTINFYGVVLVLLISVTYIGFLQPPGGLDNDGRIKQHGHLMNRYIAFVYGSFFVAAAGIFVCMSCVAFVLPHNTRYARPTLTGNMSYKNPAMGSNSVNQEILDIELKANDTISRTLKVAHIHHILANLCFVLSFTFSIYAFVKSSLIVMNSQQKHDFERSLFPIIVGWIISVASVLYMGLLFWHIIRAVIDLSVDLIELIKRLPSHLRPGVRFNPSSSLLERLRNSRTNL